MTLQELSALYDIKKEIEMDERRLEELEYIPGTAEQQEKVRKIIQEKHDKLWEERARLEKWIAEIPDSMTRQIFTMRFVCGKTWAQVAWYIGGGNTEAGVRMAAKRYVKRNA
jgi:hypothetical protein